MDKTLNDLAARKAVVGLLERKGWSVADAATGSGVPKFSRIVMERNGDKVACAIKVTSSGRIRFSRKDDGGFYVLDEVDQVIHVWRFADSGRTRLVLSAFDVSVVIEAFAANHAEKVKQGQEHIPSWVSPNFEKGWRFAGSGFQSKALWSETIDPGPPMPVAEKASSEPRLPAPTDHTVGIMDRIKTMLSQHMGVRAELIEIDVRVKL